MTERESAVETLYALGHQLFCADRHEEAAELFRAMVLVAPSDERGWVALGACHELLGQHVIARELYGTGRFLAAPAGRCEVAFARALRRLGAGEDVVEEALARAEAIAEDAEDGTLHAIIAGERRVSP